VDFGQQPIAFLLTQQPTPGGVAHQLVRILHVEIRQPGGGPDDVAQGVGHRAAQHVGDAG